MAGFNSPPCAGPKNNRPSLRVDSTFNITGMNYSGQEASPLNSPSTPLSALTGPRPNATGRVFSNAEVSDIWNSHVESMFSLMGSGPPGTRWIAASPVVTQFGEQLFTRTSQEALTRIMGDNAVLVFSDEGVNIDEADVDFDLCNQGCMEDYSEDLDNLDMKEYQFGQENVLSPNLNLYAIRQMTGLSPSILARLEHAMNIDSLAPSSQPVFGQGSMGRDLPGLSAPDNNYQFGMSTPSEPTSSPIAEVEEYVYGQGGMGPDSVDLDTEFDMEYEYGFGQHDASEPDSTPYTSEQIAEVCPTMLARADTAMDIDSPAPCQSQEYATNPQYTAMTTSDSDDDALVQAYIFGENGMRLDFATLSDQMADQSRSYVVHMAMGGATCPPAPSQNQGASINPPTTAPTQPTVTGTATQPSAGTQNQVSSSMPPPPTTAQPPVTGTLIQPYGLPANAPPANPNATASAQRALANSGVSVTTNYPMSTSPRMMSTRQVNAYMDRFPYNVRFHNSPSGMETGDTVGARPLRHALQIDTAASFLPISWDSTSQPRTEAARAAGLYDSVSPRTKKSNKRKHSEI